MSKSRSMSKSFRYTFVKIPIYKFRNKDVYIRVQVPYSSKRPKLSAIHFDKLAKTKMGKVFYTLKDHRMSSSAKFGCGNNCGRFGLSETYQFYAPVNPAPPPPKAAHFGLNDTQSMSGPYSKFGQANFSNLALIGGPYPSPNPASTQTITATPVTTNKINSAAAAFGDMVKSHRARKNHHRKSSTPKQHHHRSKNENINVNNKNHFGCGGNRFGCNNKFGLPYGATSYGYTPRY